MRLRNGARMSEADVVLDEQAPEDEAPSLGRQVWSFCLANAAVLLAASTALIYGIGLFRTVAQLHAEHVQTLRGLPLSPLQGYFIAGLAVLLSPGAGLLAVIFVSLLVGIHIAFAGWGEEPGAGLPVAALALHGLRDYFERRPSRAEIAGVVAMTMAAAAFAMGVALILPLPLLELYAIVAIVSLPFLFVSPSPRSTSLRSQAQFATGLAIVAFALSLLAIVYIAPPSLDRVTIRATNGRYLRAKLLAQTSSMIYVVGRDDRGDASIVAFPTDRIARMEIVRGPKRYERSLADVLGLGWVPDLPSIRSIPSLSGTASSPIG